MNDPNQIKSISILGCGWLGWPLARRLIQLGYSVKGSTTSADKIAALKHDGILPFLIQLSESGTEPTLEQFLECDLLIINYPPGIRKVGSDHFHQSFNKLIQEIESSLIKEIIFVSSTSVYPNTNGTVDETEAAPPDSASGVALLKAEKQLRELDKKAVTILRMAGLIGYDRQPARFFAGKKGLPNGNEVVNLIHRDDCLKIIESFVTRKVSTGIYNCCSDTHPFKHEFYPKAAKVAGLEPPEFDLDSPAPFKIVANQKLKKELNYEYLYGDLGHFEWP